ncbi:MAG: UbiD family decarboxylase, partial [Dehalococcoidia bacterium]|nr:UbiD family decarboxylase [Dehalococcoidia bacterium]
MNWDVRDYIARVQAAGQLKEIKGADWDLEIGCLTSLLSKQDNCPAIIFDEIKDYPKGFRLLTAPTSNPVTLCITFGLPVISNTLELLEVLRQKLPVWQGAASANLPTVVKSGPVMENVYSGKDIDLFKFPTPRWNELDGGRYIGTGDAIITRDPDDGWTNVGTYRVMVHDKNTLGFHMSPGKHGRIHYEKLHARGKPCPIAVSIGHHPLVYRVGCLEFSPGIEYGLLGAIAGSPVPVIQEDITGLP